MAMTLLEHFDQCPPFVCFYSAHFNRSVRPTSHELAKAAGLPYRTFMRNVYRVTWKGVEVSVMCRIASACGIDLLKPEGTVKRFVEECAKETPFPEFTCRRPGSKFRANHRNRMLQSLNRFSARAVMARG